MRDNFLPLKKAFIALWSYPALLSYKIFFVAIAILARTFLGYSLLLLFITTFVKYYLDVALAHATFAILAHKKPSIPQSLRASITAMLALMPWTLLWVGLSFVGLLGDSGIVLEYVIMIVLIFFGFYVLPLFALGRSFINACITSITLACKTPAEIIIGTLLLLPLGKLLKIVGGYVMLEYHSWVGISAGCLIVLGEAACMTLLIMYRTVCFKEMN